MQFMSKPVLFILIVIGILGGLVVLAMIPIAEKNIFFMLAIPFAAFFFLVMVLRPKETLVLLIFVRSLLDLLLENTRVNVSSSSAGIGGILNLLIIGLALILIFNDSGQFSKVFFFVRWWVLFILVCAISVTYSPDKAKTFKFVLQQVSSMLIFVIPFFIVKNSQDKKFWIKVLLFSSILPLLIADFGLISKNHLLYVQSSDVGWRLRGTFTHANILSFYMVLLIVIVFYILKTDNFSLSAQKKNMLRLYMLNLVGILLATQARTAVVSCWLFFVLYGLLKEKKYLVIILFLSLLVGLTPQVRERITTLQTKNASKADLDKNSFHWRTMLWSDTLPMIQGSPIYGHGAGSFIILSHTFARVGSEGAYAHNVYLEILFETGVIGLVCYLAFFLMLLKLYFLNMVKGVGNISVEGAILFSYLVGYLAVCFADNMLIYITFNWYFFLFLGVITRALFFSEKNEGAQAL